MVYSLAQLHELAKLKGFRLGSQAEGVSEAVADTAAASRQVHL